MTYALLANRLVSNFFFVCPSPNNVSTSLRFDSFHIASTILSFPTFSNACLNSLLDCDGFPLIIPRISSLRHTLGHLSSFIFNISSIYLAALLLIATSTLRFPASNFQNIIRCLPCHFDKSHFAKAILPRPFW